MFMITAITDAIVRTVFPRMCGRCAMPINRLSLGAACASCWNRTRIFTGEEPCCSKCRKIIEGSITTSEETASTLCGRCDGHHYDRVFSIGFYEKALKVEVLNLKREPFIGSVTVGLLANTLRRIDRTNAILVPVPLSRRRLKERGFNQAELIARKISKTDGIKMLKDVLLRTAHTPIHRAGMDAKARDATVRKAFAVFERSEIEGRKIILVDDVFTSGATTSHCARVLKEAGATGVDVLTIARTR